MSQIVEVLVIEMCVLNSKSSNVTEQGGQSGPGREHSPGLLSSMERLLLMTQLHDSNIIRIPENSFIINNLSRLGNSLTKFEALRKVTK